MKIMPTHRIEIGTWIVVCDGKKALILENEGDSKFPNLQVREEREHQLQRTHEIGTDVPGRVFASVGAARSSTEQTDWHARSEQEFLHALIQHLDEAVRKGRTKTMVIVAPPRALGILRLIYTAALRSAVVAEITHDFVKLPVAEIEKRLFKEVSA